MTIDTQNAFERKYVRYYNISRLIFVLPDMTVPIKNLPDKHHPQTWSIFS
jgi:hypothetical protein